jgi:hypothetical protein
MSVPGMVALAISKAIKRPLLALGANSRLGPKPESQAPMAGIDQKRTFV